MTKAKFANTIIGVAIPLPIWYYLIYTMLKGIDAIELQMFLWWIYMPSSLVTQVLARFLGGEDKN